MGFDAKEFLRTKWTPRTEDVPVPDLKDFFPEGEKLLWKVRGLTGVELGRVAEAAERNKNVETIIEMVGSEYSKEKIAAIKEMLGLGGSVPQDVAKRLEYLVIGSVDPKCTLDLAVRICEVRALDFYRLTNSIKDLSGQGHVPGKQPPSGETPKSAPASPSATPGGVSSTK